MKTRLLVLLTVLALVGSVGAAIAQDTGSIYGKVTDASGATMPGVTVTLTGTVLLQPQTAITTETGTFQFPRLAIGLYTVKFDLAGFKTIVKQGVRVEIGLNAQVNETLAISTVQETVTVSGEVPLVDLKDTSKTSRFTQESLQSIPSARDPWVILEQSAGIVMDRQNIGGNASGQQSNFVARGASTTQQKWNLDGVDITDMSATGGSPVYYDFDAFEEMQISTGGADVTMQTPGVGINLVTKSGTDKFRGSGRYYVTSQRFESVNITDALRTQGATSGNPIQDIRDYGIEVGGPIKKGRAWIWASYGVQNVKVGVNGFYQPSTACAAVKAAPLTFKIKEVWDCLNTDLTELKTFNTKAAFQITRNNQFSFFMNAAGKIRNARGADDLHPIETTSRQMGVDNPALGSGWWKTGVPKTYKWSDRQIFSDRFMMEIQYAHVGNNFVLDFHEPDLSDVQPSLDTTTSMNGRSSSRSIYVRPTDSIDVTGNYFLTSFLGGDNAIKFGFKYRNDIAHSEGHTGGNAIARFHDVLVNGSLTPVAYEGQITRDSVTEYGLHNRSFYLSDGYTRRKLTVNVGFRYDYQTDFANGSTVPGSPFYGKTTGLFNADGTYAGPGATFPQLPSVTFAGAQAGVAYKTWSPRVGLTYDLLGSGRSVVKASFAHYVGQLGTGSLSGTYNPVSSAYVRYPWHDLNGDGFIQANEIDISAAAPLASSSGYNYLNPAQLTTTGKIDPNLTDEKTNEFIASFDQQIGNQFAVSASYIYRKYTNFSWSPLDNWSSANYVAAQYTPPAANCPVAGALCNQITYYQRTSQPGTAYTLTNQPGYYRTYSGLEVSVRKRMSNRWMANASFSYSNTPQHYPAGSYQDPTNIANLDGGQYAPQTSGSGLDNVFLNSAWLLRASGSYTLPLGEVNIAGFYNARGGYPFPQTVQTPTRPFSGGQADVYVFQYGSARLPNYQAMDFRVDRPFTVGHHVKMSPSVDIFNLFNTATVQSRRTRQNSTIANNISSIVAPRVARFGVRVTW
ncbi:MAG: carboxypeptidase-like regulatory domain-containing protein [Acidobacteria bacterium]|nr:carboxypeptidase-like regulatory domain-containing protein [Acidobacteriota bacterium]